MLCIVIYMCVCVVVLCGWSCVYGCVCVWLSYVLDLHSFVGAHLTVYVVVRIWCTLFASVCVVVLRGCSYDCLCVVVWVSYVLQVVRSLVCCRFCCRCCAQMVYIVYIYVFVYGCPVWMILWCYQVLYGVHMCFSFTSCIGLCCCLCVFVYLHIVYILCVDVLCPGSYDCCVVCGCPTCCVSSRVTWLCRMFIYVAHRV